MGPGVLGDYRAASGFVCVVWIGADGAVFDVDRVAGVNQSRGRFGRYGGDPTDGKSLVAEVEGRGFGCRFHCG